MEVLRHPLFIPIVVSCIFVLLVLVARLGQGSTRAAGYLFGGLLGLALALGVIPGVGRWQYEGLNLNLGKVLVFFTLALILPSPVKWSKAAWAWLCAGLAGLPLLGWQMGLLHWQPAVSAALLWFALNNLFSVLAEDFFFRRFVQDHLSGLGVVLEILVTGALFGLAHWSSGQTYAFLAGIAGCCYAAMYRASGDSVWAVSALHWLVNLTGAVLFAHGLRT
ncbi:CPBP family intramembrane glutamic endopeptidase [Massilia sp. W12]|uniref:CPBP family intramembrane glutamic endopeptidase n=1 Tax=Massilia sp. W12 TaxID=3126507 RepID=UPI0030D33578